MAWVVVDGCCLRERCRAWLAVLEMHTQLVDVDMSMMTYEYLSLHYYQSLFV